MNVELPQNLQVLRVASRGRDHLIGDFRIEFRDSSADYFWNTRRSVEGGSRISPPKLARELHLAGIGVRDRELPNLTLFDDVDAAPVGERGNGELGYSLNRRGESPVTS